MNKLRDYFVIIRLEIEQKEHDLENQEYDFYSLLLTVRLKSQIHYFQVPSFVSDNKFDIHTGKSAIPVLKKITLADQHP